MFSVCRHESGLFVINGGYLVQDCFVACIESADSFLQHLSAAGIFPDFSFVGMGAAFFLVDFFGLHGEQAPYGFDGDFKVQFFEIE